MLLDLKLDLIEFSMMMSLYRPVMTCENDRNYYEHLRD